MRKLFVTVLIGALACMVAAPALAEHPVPKLVDVDARYQPKGPPLGPPTVPGPGEGGVRTIRIKGPVAPPSPTKTGGPGYDSVNMKGSTGIGSASAIPAAGRGGGAAVSEMQEAHRSLKRLMRDLG